MEIVLALSPGAAPMPDATSPLGMSPEFASILADHLLLEGAPIAPADIVAPGLVELGDPAQSFVQALGTLPPPSPPAAVLATGAPPGPPIAEGPPIEPLRAEEVTVAEPNAPPIKLDLPLELQSLPLGAAAFLPVEASFAPAQTDALAEEPEADTEAVAEASVADVAAFAPSVPAEPVAPLAEPLLDVNAVPNMTAPSLLTERGMSSSAILPGVSPRPALPAVEVAARLGTDRPLATVEVPADDSPAPLTASTLVDLTPAFDPAVPTKVIATVSALEPARETRPDLSAEPTDAANLPETDALDPLQPVGTASAGATADSSSDSGADGGKEKLPNGQDTLNASGEPKRKGAAEFREPLRSEVEAAAATPSAPTEARPAATRASSDLRPITPAERTQVVRQVAERIELLAAARPRDGIVIRLDPPDLGRITLVVKAAAESVEAQMAVENPSVREALQQSRPELAAALERKGLTLTSATFSADASPDRGFGQAAQAFGDSQQSRQPSTGTYPGGPTRFSPYSAEADLPDIAQLRTLRRTSAGIDYWI